ncbi:MAG: DUF488 domain-containing protein [Geminicoccaceae bacterium]
MPAAVPWAAWSSILSPGNGRRILVERLWPRGLRKEDAQIDLWLKEVAPSHALRRWFHEALEERWPAFRDRYREELRVAAEPLAELRGFVQREPVTLRFAAREEARNRAVVLKAVLDEELG